jgi:hypothetical protein
MKVLDVFRWLMPAVLAALLSVPVQSANARGMGGGGGHMGGGRGGGHMGGRVRMGGIGRGHPGVTSHFISRTGASRFRARQSLAFRNNHFGRFARQGRFADRGRFGNGRFGGEGRFEGRGGFWRGRGWGGWGWGGWGWGPWWWGWGGPWWWSWGYPYPYYGDYGYGYGYYPYYGDPQGYASQDNDPPDNGSQYDAEYWKNLAMSVQTKLADQGYYHGQVDGVIGSGTIDAVRKFQADHGLTTTGKIDPQLLNALGIDYKAQS